MLKFAALAVTANCIFAFLCADVSAQLEPQFQEPILSSDLIIPPLESQTVTPSLVIQQPPVELPPVELPPVELPPVAAQLTPEPVEVSEPFTELSIEQMVQEQPPYLPESQFMWRSGNGLPTKGVLWLSLERVFGKYQDSDSLIGDARAPQAFNDRFMAVNLDVFNGAHIGLTELNPALVGQQVVSDDPTGTRLRTGYRTSNNGAIEFDGLWMDDNERYWKRGLGSLTSGADPTTVRITAALPLYDGADGYAVPFDQFFRVGITTETSVYGLHFAPRGQWWGAILLQPTLSVRFLDLKEGLGFAAADSGLSYQHNADGTPVATSLDPPVAAVPPYQSILTSTGSTSLVGPLFGMNYSSTGRAIRFSGSTRAGVFLADSTQSLSGRGFGNGFAPGFDPAITFSDSESSNYATAALEQNLNVDIDVLRILPPFSSNKGDSSLVLRLGWSIMALHSVIRPVDSIDWNGFPLTPQVNGSKDNWYLQTWSVGALYQY